MARWRGRCCCRVFWRSQKPLNASRNCGGVGNFALPQHQDLPAHSFKDAQVTRVTVNIFLQLFGPPRTTCSREGRAFTTGMAMPETSAYLNHHEAGTEGEIGSP